MVDRPIILDREYIIQYAGAPVKILYEGMENIAYILGSQYVEVNSETLCNVTCLV